MEPALARRLRDILAVPGDRVGKARRITAAIRETYGFRWLGIHDVDGDGTRVVAWSGPALSAVRSEIRTPIMDGAASVVAFLDAQSDVPDAFGIEDRKSLEECARLVAPLWG